MGAVISTARQETRRWRIERTKETGDPKEYRRVILPGLERAPLAKIMEARGGHVHGFDDPVGEDTGQETLGVLRQIWTSLTSDLE